LIRNVAVCSVGGGMMGALTLFTPDLIGYGFDMLSTGSFMVFLFAPLSLGSMLGYGVAMALPIGIPAGALATGLVWWLRPRWTS
jgi:hypothetical protein